MALMLGIYLKLPEQKKNNLQKIYKKLIKKYKIQENEISFSN